MATPKDILEALRESRRGPDGSLDDKLVHDAAFFRKYGQFVPSRKPVASAFEDFNVFQAEDLLRDGCMLLDRALRERAEVRLLATKLFEAEIQIDELLELDKIWDDEEEAALAAAESGDRG